MFKDPFDARLIFLSELNMRFDVTACAGAASTNIRIQFSDRFLFPPSLPTRCNNSCVLSLDVAGGRSKKKS